MTLSQSLEGIERDRTDRPVPRLAGFMGVGALLQRKHEFARMLGQWGPEESKLWTMADHSLDRGPKLERSVLCRLEPGPDQLAEYLVTRDTPSVRDCRGAPFERLVLVRHEVRNLGPRCYPGLPDEPIALGQDCCGKDPRERQSQTSQVGPERTITAGDHGSQTFRSRLIGKHGVLPVGTVGSVFAGFVEDFADQHIGCLTTQRTVAALTREEAHAPRQERERTGVSAPADGNRLPHLAVPRPRGSFAAEVSLGGTGWWQGVIPQERLEEVLAL